MALLLLWLAFWLTLTHVPGPPPGAIPDWLSDKAIHFTGYAVTGILTISVLKGRGVSGRPRILVWWAALTALAIVDESTQLLVGRALEWSDGIADVAGAGAGLAAASFLRARWFANARRSK